MPQNYMPVQEVIISSHAVTIEATLLWFTLKSHCTGQEHVVTYDNNNPMKYLYYVGML